MPEALRRASDWRYFQDCLDQAAIVITGRHGHEAHPNKPGRRRMVFTSQKGTGFEQAGDVCFLDPARFDFEKACRLIAPEGGVIAVTGGGPVFDWFAAGPGYDAFHLVRALGCSIPGGRPMFASGAAEPELRRLGLDSVEHCFLSETEPTELRLFRRRAAP